MDHFAEQKIMLVTVFSTQQLPHQLCDNLLMNNSNTYAGYRYSAQIFSHVAWFYHRFELNFRDIE